MCSMPRFAPGSSRCHPGLNHSFPCVLAPFTENTSLVPDVQTWVLLSGDAQASEKGHSSEALILSPLL